MVDYSSITYNLISSPFCDTKYLVLVTIQWKYTFGSTPKNINFSSFLIQAYTVR